LKWNGSWALNHFLNFPQALEDFLFDRNSIFLYFCNQPMWLLNIILTLLILHNCAMCFSETWNFDNVIFVCSYMLESFQESWELWHSILLICMLDQLVHPIPFPRIHVDPSNSVKDRKVWFLIKTCELKTIAKSVPQVSLFLLVS
jgi:hypothetical protein